MLSYARNEEERRAKDELTKQLLPLWLLRYAPEIIKGEQAPVSFEEFMNKTLSGSKQNEKAVQTPVKQRSPEEIEAELMSYVAADRLRGG